MAALHLAVQLFSSTAVEVAWKEHLLQVIGANGIAFTERIF
jgi:hypothetical protein